MFEQNHENFRLVTWCTLRIFGQGQVWLPDNITDIQGSMLYTFLLDDGRTVCKHADQLRLRTVPAKSRVDPVQTGDEGVIDDDNTLAAASTKPMTDSDRITEDSPLSIPPRPPSTSEEPNEIEAGDSPAPGGGTDHLPSTHPAPPQLLRRSAWSYPPPN